MKRILLAIATLTVSLFSYGECVDGTVTDYSIVSDDDPNFTNPLVNGGAYGRVEVIGDVDNNGVKDLVTSAVYENNKEGVLRLVYMDEDNTVLKTEIMSHTELDAELGSNDRFGFSLANIGDINGDGNDDLAVGASQDDEGANDGGAVYILFLDDKGQILDYSKIGASEITGLSNKEYLGQTGSITNLGDVNNDGVNDIAVGAPAHPDLSPEGKVYILCLTDEGAVAEQYVIDDDDLGGILPSGSTFGFTVTNVGDIDNSGTIDLAVHARDYNAYGAVFVLLMNADFTVKSHTLITQGEGGFTGTLQSGKAFGAGLTNAGDLNHDGITDVWAGSYGGEYGAIFGLYLDTDGSVKDYIKIEGTTFTEFSGNEQLSSAIKTLGDINGDGAIDFSVSVNGYDGSGTDRGAFLIFNVCGQTVETNQPETYSVTGEVHYEDSSMTGATIELIDFWGKIIETQTITGTQYAFENLPAETYVLKVYALDEDIDVFQDEVTEQVLLPGTGDVDITIPRNYYTISMSYNVEDQSSFFGTASISRLENFENWEYTLIESKEYTEGVVEFSVKAGYFYSGGIGPDESIADLYGSNGVGLIWLYKDESYEWGSNVKSHYLSAYFFSEELYRANAYVEVYKNEIIEENLVFTSAVDTGFGGTVYGDAYYIFKVYPADEIKDDYAVTITDPLWIDRYTHLVPIELQKRSYSVSGNVIKSSLSDKYGSIELFQDVVSGENFVKAVSIEDGEFVFENVSVGTYKLVVVPSDEYIEVYSKVEFEYSVSVSENVGGIEIDLESGTITSVEGVESVVSMYPNPVANFLFVESPSDIKSIELYSAKGSLMSKAIETSSVDVSMLPLGTYIVVIDAENGQTIHTVIKE